MKKVQEVKKEQEVKPEEQVLTLKVEDANQFVAILDVVLVGDDRLKPLKTHFVEILKRNNEKATEQ